MTPETASTKRTLLRMLLGTDRIVNVVAIADGNSTMLPEKFKSKPVILLQYGTRLEVPIPDLELSRNGIHATLSFDRIPFETYVAWDAVIGMGLHGETIIGVQDPPERALAKPEEPRRGLKLV